MHPFHAPDNQVGWIANEDAVRLGKYGTLLSTGSFSPPEAGERSIEIWVQPRRAKDSSTVIAFYSPASPRQLSLAQSDSDLEIRIQSSDAWRKARIDRLYLDDAFRDRSRVFWTVTLGHAGTAIYRNGVLVKSSRLTPSPGEISGRLIAGASPVFDDGWTGILQGLAIYDTALNLPQVLRHYASWTKRRAPVLAANDSCIALYLFNEHNGRVVHNNVRAENDLYIPAKYMILRKTVLDPVWRAINWSRGFREDAFINVAGFIPFGFFFCAWFAARKMSMPALRASALGAGVSLLIELTQSVLPTRDSSMADLINNTLGSVLGAVACRGVPALALERVMLSLEKTLEKRANC